jgi:subtilisin family serine protease
MKHKAILIGIVVTITLVIVGLLVYYFALQPAKHQAKTKTDDTPIVTYDQPNNSTRPTMTEEQKKEANAPGQKTPTSQSTTPDTPATAPVRTDNAPKQTEVRESVTQEYTYYPLGLPNDPGYASSWALQRVNAPAAWNVVTGNGSTTVAVIDTGFSLLHDDLKDNWLINSGESGTTQTGDRCWTGVAQNKTINNCDDDNNGYVDDYRGWNFYLGDNNPQAGRLNPNGAAVAHGTETAGLAGASGNNNTGIATINWNTKIMPLQALSDDGPGYSSDIVAAIYYAVDNGADVINLSLGGSSYDAPIKAAIDYAYAHNIPVVAAAGNCGSGTEPGCSGQPAGTMSYPALFDHVISVGASDSNNHRASFSSYGPSLSVLAPGSGTLVSPTWTPANGTSLYSGALYGTSYATPQVASLVSLIKSIRPSSTTDDIRALIMATASKIPDMNGSFYTAELGHGVINAGNAVATAISLNTTTTTPTLLQAGGAVSEHSFRASDILGSGCVSQTTSYCSVRLRNDDSGYERYLPYQQLTSTNTGWTWPSNLMSNGEWRVQAVQGDRQSPSYLLSSK